jgi:hypothetical protein
VSSWSESSVLRSAAYRDMFSFFEK